MAPEQDPRIYFAAERTFLAWIRTGLALMGFGFVVARFGLFLREMGAASVNFPIRSTGFSLWIGTALVMAGVIVNTLSAVEYIRSIGQLKQARYVVGRVSTTGVALAVVLALVGMAMAIYLLVMR
ncbi:MAG: DUF202 domain-containing protein [Acidobacteriota bacterium]